MPWASKKNHSTPVPLACLQMGAEQSSRDAGVVCIGWRIMTHCSQTQTTIRPQQARKATKSPLPCRRTDHPEFRQVWSLQGPPGSWGNITIFLHFPPCTRMCWRFPLIAHGQREKVEKECGIQIEAAPLQLQTVLHSTDVSQGHTPPVPCLLQVGWVPGTFIHTGSLAKKHSTLSKLCKKHFPWVKVIFSTLNHAVSHF